MTEAENEGTQKVERLERMSRKERRGQSETEQDGTNEEGVDGKGRRLMF